MTADELEAFFYKFVIHRSVRSSWSWIERWWEDDREDFIEAIHTSTIAEYPVLEDAPPSFYGPRLHEPAFVETVRQACSMEDNISMNVSEPLDIWRLMIGALTIS